MSFVSTGFKALDDMLAGSGGCKGFPRGGLTLLEGSPGGGKTQILRECCARAHKKGLHVVYIDTDNGFESKYPSIFQSSLNEVSRLIAQLLHPGKKDKTDLLVIDSIDHLISDNTPDSPLGVITRQVAPLLRAESFGQTAMVCTSSRTNLLTIGIASVILSVTNTSGTYRLVLEKSRVSTTGVSCEIRPIDMEDFDRSRVLTRYQRILRGRNQTPHF